MCHIELTCHSSADTHIAHFVSNDEKTPMIITVRRAVADDERLVRIHAVISTPEVRDNIYAMRSQNFVLLLPPVLFNFFCLPR